MLKYEEHLQNLPDVLDRAHSKRSILELQGARPKRPRLSRKSVRKHFDYLGSMFKFGKLRGYCAGDPTEGIKPRLEKRPADPPRIIYTDAEVKALFSSPNCCGHAGDDYRVTAEGGRSGVTAGPGAEGPSAKRACFASGDSDR